MSILKLGEVGVSSVSDGAEVGARFSNTGALVTSQGHGRFAEASMRGNVYVISSPLAGTTAAAAHLSPVAAAAASLLTLYNPQSSGYLASILRVTGDFISGTVEVGTYTWNFHGICSISATPNAIANKCLINGASAAAPQGNMKGFADTALTGGLLGIQGPPIGMWATAGTQRFDQDIDGAIVIPEGCAATIAAPTNGTSTVARFSIWYEEIRIA